MKVIAKVTEELLIAEITKTELKKYLDRYYGRVPLDLSVGREIDLGKGHDFSVLTERALNATTEVLKLNKNVIDLITNGYKRGSETDKDV